MKNLLFKLIQTPSLVGSEDAVLESFRNAMSPHADNTWTDRVGNVISVKNAGKKYKVLLVAHADEVGLLVTNITEKGFLLCKSMGMGAAAMLVGQRVSILGKNEAIPGIIQSKIKKDKNEKPVKFADLFIDIGAKDKKEAEKWVSPGDYVYVTSRPIDFGNGLVVGKGMDDKAGMTVIAHVMKELAHKDVDKICLYCAAAVGEEINSHGARAMAAALQPDLAIAVDVTETMDKPGSDPIDGCVELKKGPVLARVPILCRRIEERLRATAQQYRIPCQTEVYPYLSYTDADYIHTAAQGILSHIVSIPLRYMHSPQEIIAVQDLEHTRDLLKAFLKELNNAPI